MTDKIGVSLMPPLYKMIITVTACILILPGLLSADPSFPLPNIEPPSIPDYTANITDFGAVGDGQTSDTQAFTRTLAACTAAGGGRIIVPAGIWLTGPIQLKSNIDLHLERGAVIRFSDRFEDYPLIQTTWEGSAAVRCMSPIQGINLTNIAITGQGILDGSGGVWRSVKKSKMTDQQWKTLINSGGVLNPAGDVWWPDKAALNGPQLVSELQKRNAPVEDYAPLRAYLRPVMISLINCKNVLLDGPTFQNSPAWNIHPLLCENVLIQNVSVRNPWYAQNGDGLDLESCKNAVVAQCCFDVGDDAICLKSGRDEYGRQRGKPCENIWITVGSEMSGGVYNVFVNNCTFLGTDVGLRFKSTRGRGGIVKNIFLENIRMSDILTDAIRFNMFYGGTAPTETDDAVQTENVPVDEGTPRFRNIHIKHLICTGADRAVWLQGLPEMAIQQISLEDALISSRTGIVCAEADDITLTHVTLKTNQTPAVRLYNSRNVTFQDVTVPEAGVPYWQLAGAKTDNILIQGEKVSP